jgi:hypothetical protein
MVHRTLLGQVGREQKMSLDVMIVADVESIASHSDEAMFDWLEERFEDFEIRYGSVSLDEDDVHELVAKYEDDEVGSMLIAKVERMRAAGERAPYIIELMIG